MFRSRLCSGINIYESRLHSGWSEIWKIDDTSRSWTLASESVPQISCTLKQSLKDEEHQSKEREKNIEDEIKKKPEINIEIKSCSRFFSAVFVSIVIQSASRTERDWTRKGEGKEKQSLSSGDLRQTEKLLTGGNCFIADRERTWNVEVAMRLKGEEELKLKLQKWCLWRLRASRVASRHVTHFMLT